MTTSSVPAAFAPGTPAWIDLGTTDVPGAAAFYGALFGWELEDMGPESGGYGLFRKDGRQVAGLGPATDETRGTSWSVYFATESADDAESRVAAEGGTVVVPAGDVMDQGRMAVFQDPAGAYFSVWQAAAHRGMELVRAPGGLAWTELYSSDVAAVKSFYANVLGVATRDVQFAPDMTYTVLEVDGQTVAGAMASPDGSSRWALYFEVADVDAVADQALALGGGELMRGETAAGRMAIHIDPQGGVYCMIKSNPDFSV